MEKRISVHIAKKLDGYAGGGLPGYVVPESGEELKPLYAIEWYTFDPIDKETYIGDKQGIPSLHWSKELRMVESLEDAILVLKDVIDVVPEEVFTNEEIIQDCKRLYTSEEAYNRQRDLDRARNELFTNVERMLRDSSFGVGLVVDIDMRGLYYHSGEERLIDLISIFHCQMTSPSNETPLETIQRKIKEELT